jgi:hypothetical protein
MNSQPMGTKKNGSCNIPWLSTVLPIKLNPSPHMAVREKNIRAVLKLNNRVMIDANMGFP